MIIVYFCNRESPYIVDQSDFVVGEYLLIKVADKNLQVHVTLTCLLLSNHEYTGSDFIDSGVFTLVTVVSTAVESELGLRCGSTVRLTLNYHG